MNQKQKEIYMKKAIRIAHKGINNTGLNPIVGAVLVKLTDIQAPSGPAITPARNGNTYICAWSHRLDDDAERL